MSSLHIAILLPFLFAFFVPLLYKKFPRIHTGWFVLPIPMFIFGLLAKNIPSIAEGKTWFETALWIPSYDINFTLYIDGLSLIFGLLISGIGSLVILYSIYYLAKEREALGNFYAYLLLFMGSMFGVVFSDNIFILYVFWEITSISSFLLIAYWYERETSQYGAQKSMLITVFGGLAMLAGFVMLTIMADTNSLREMIVSAGNFKEHELFFPAMIFILIGAFTKSAQFPFSIWLPDAMEAPTPVSAYLHSATMVKAGIYLVARLTPVFGGSSEWFWLVSAVGLVTLLYGSINAVRQTDLKALLAYSTVSQLGLIMSLLGMGSAALYFQAGNESAFYAVAIFAAIFHLVNHSTFKGALFMVVGIIDHEAGTRDIRRLGGLMQVMPVSFTLALIGAFSMAGLPPFNGFLSKEMFFASTLNVAKMNVFHVENVAFLFPLVAWVASVFTFIYCMIFLFKTFKGKYKLEIKKEQLHEAPVGMLVSPVILAGLVVLIFFFPNLLGQYLLKPAFSAILPFSWAEQLETRIHVWHGFNPELFMTIGVVVLGTMLYVSIKKWYNVYQYIPEWFSLNRLYDFTLEKGETLARWTTNKYMTGFLRDYLVYIFLFMIFTAGSFLIFQNVGPLHFSQNAPVEIYEIGLVMAMIASALTVLFTNSRFTSIIALGALGFFVAFFFVLFRAPDLALTQLVVETVTTVLFLLCFYHLPVMKKEFSRIRFKAVNAIVAVGSGATVTLFALYANSNQLFETISAFYEKSYELAGAKNIVNAILVDFRGFDTMLEILVLTMAGLGVYTLIKLRRARRE